MEPLTTISTVSSATGFAKNLFEQVKPSNSPYVLVTAACALCAELALKSDYLFIEQKWMIIVPTCIIISVLSWLAFFFKPFNDKELTEKDGADLSERQMAIKLELDTQFKLGRIYGLTTGVVCLMILAYRRIDVDIYYMIIWLIILLHIAVYVLYNVNHNFTEESLSNKQYFQLSFMTSLFLVFFTLSGSDVVPSQDWNLSRKCSVEVSFMGNKISPNPKKNDGLKQEEGKQEEEEVDSESDMPEDEYHASSVIIDQPCINRNSVYKHDLETKIKSVIAESGYNITQFEANPAKFQPRSISRLNLCVPMFYQALWTVYMLFWVKNLIKIRKKK